MRKVDGEIHLKVRIRQKLGELVSHLDAYRFEDFDVATGYLLFSYTSLLDQIDERRRRAIHDRHFEVVEFDDRVVNATTDAGREQVLDGGDFGLTMHQRRG